MVSHPAKPKNCCETNAKPCFAACGVAKQLFGFASNTFTNQCNFCVRNQVARGFATFCLRNHCWNGAKALRNHCKTKKNPLRNQYETSGCATPRGFAFFFFFLVSQHHPHPHPHPQKIHISKNYDAHHFKQFRRYQCHKCPGGR